MDESEERELAECLEVEVEYLRGPFRVIDAECPRCGRRITFLDFVKTAVDKGVHDRTRAAGHSDWQGGKLDHHPGP